MCARMQRLRCDTNGVRQRRRPQLQAAYKCKRLTSRSDITCHVMCFHPQAVWAVDAGVNCSTAALPLSLSGGNGGSDVTSAGQVLCDDLLFFVCVRGKSGASRSDADAGGNARRRDALTG